MELDCATTLVCDQAGDCEPNENDFSAVIQPAETDSDGAGTYEVSSSGGSFPGTSDSRTGPFRWKPDTFRTAVLTLTSETTALHVLQDLTPGDETSPSARITFLNCEVTF